MSGRAREWWDELAEMEREQALNCAEGALLGAAGEVRYRARDAHLPDDLRNLMLRVSQELDELAKECVRRIG